MITHSIFWESFANFRCNLFQIYRIRETTNPIRSGSIEVSKKNTKKQNNNMADGNPNIETSPENENENVNSNEQHEEIDPISVRASTFKARLQGFMKLLNETEAADFIEEFVNDQLTQNNFSKEENAANFRSFLDQLSTKYGEVNGIGNLVYKIVVIGDTSVGKDALCSALLGVPIHHSSKKAATSRWDHISQKYDPSLGANEIKIKVTDKATNISKTFSSITDAKNFKISLHPELSEAMKKDDSFGVNNCVFTEISEGRISVYPVSFWNAVGLRSKSYSISLRYTPVSKHSTLPPI